MNDKENTFFFLINGMATNTKGIYNAAAEKRAIPNGEQVISVKRNKTKVITFL